MPRDPGFEIRKADLTEISVLLPMMRAYCDFYEVAPRDDRLVALSRSLLQDSSAGLQQIAWAPDGEPLGFSTLYWSWSTLAAGRIGVMNDLFVWEEHRSRGVGLALIEACRASCRKRGVATLTWSTAPDNLRAQALYEKTGASSSNWIDYELEAW